MQQFINKVNDMRQAQKSYFQTRKKGVLIRAKQLESEVDKMLTQLITDN